LYKQGKSLPRDDTKAAKWYHKAAEQGHAKAQYQLGWAYLRGEGVLEDDIKGVKWYRKAAEQGHVDAQFWLGFSYEYGRGAPKDKQKAYMWYFLAIENGNEDAKDEATKLEQRLSPGQITAAKADAEKMQVKIDKMKNGEY